MARILSLRNPEEIKGALEALRVDEVGVGMMLHKAHHHLLLLESVNVPAANILKQEMLSIGGDAALDKRACDFSVRETPCLLMGTHQQFLRLSKKLQLQPFGLKKTGKEIRQTLQNYLSAPPPLRAGPHTLEFSKKPLIMGILNVTPDSFSGEGVGKDLNLLLKRAEEMIKNGADIVDVGGESTRPGHAPVSLEEEAKRVIPAVKALARRFRVPLSVDTSKPDVARRALEAGAHLVNDIRGMKDREMAEAAKAFGAPVVVMHNKEEAVYQDVMGEICAYFEKRLQSLEKMGVAREKIILDPGIGFGKTAEQNLVILKNLSEFKIFGRPLLLGTSRKSFIGKITGAEVGERLPGSLASQALGYSAGFHIFRVHDVKEARQALQVAQAILEGRM